MTIEADRADRLIAVADYVSVPEAELARVRLAREGIPARLDNVGLITWFWHYSYAVGGVKVLILDAQAERAAKALRPQPTPAEPNRRCDACDAEMPESWSVCWSCGAPDGFEQPAGEGFDAGQPDETTGQSRSDAAGMVPLIVALLYILTGDLPGLMALGLIGAAAYWMFPPTASAIGSEVETAEPPTGGEHDAPHVRRDTKTDTGDELAQRAWQSSVLGLFCFPPLVFYALYLLVQLTRHELPVSRSGSRRRTGAWVVGVLALVPACLILGVLVLGVGFEIAHVLGRYFDFERAFPH